MKTTQIQVSARRRHGRSIRSRSAWSLFFGPLLLGSGILLAAPPIARSQGTGLPPDSFSYANFRSSNGLSLVGNASTFDNRVRLTPADFGQIGAAWITFKQPVGDGFDTTFQFRITELGGGNVDGLGNIGADGFTFVIQNSDSSSFGGGGSSALGSSGGGLGYAGIPNSLAVEFDTWFNPVLGDPNGNHISVHTAGTLQNTDNEVLSLGSTTAIPDLSDGTTHTARIAYIPGTLQIFLDDLTNPALTVPADLGAILNLDHGHAWVGFTAATGGGFENHDILSWSYTRTQREICNDGLDNDGDGLVDGNDPDCQNVHRPLQISLTPETASGLLNSPYTITALVTDADGTPQPGMFVWFQVFGPNFPVNSGHLGGQNQGCAPSDCRTDGSGTVRWTYLGGGFPGTDIIYASAYDPGVRTRFEGTATKDWQAPPPPPPGNGDGLLGVYYDNNDFTGTAVTRVDPVVAFSWGLGSPDPAIQPDTFSVRWTGQVQAQFSETYIFWALTDDGFRLWVDDQLVIDGFIDQGPTFYSGSIPLLADQKYKIQIDYFENFGGAVAELIWTSPSTPFQIIPQSQLYSVLPVPPPSCTLICPQDITVSNDPGTCGAVLNYPPPTTSSDCFGLTITCSPPSGSTFPAGTNWVTCTARDANNNSLATCSFRVFVNDIEAPNGSCAVVKAPALFANPPRIVGSFQLLATDNCDPDPLIYIKGSVGSFVAGPFHNGDQVEIAHGPRLIPRQAPSTSGGSIASIQLNGDALLWAVDSTGNASTPIKCK